MKISLVMMSLLALLCATAAPAETVEPAGGTTIAAPKVPSAEQALAAWQETRVAYGRQTVEWSRDLGSYIGPPSDDAVRRAKAVHHQRPAVLLGATAASDYQRFLYR